MVGSFPSVQTTESPPRCANSPPSSASPAASSPSHPPASLSLDPDSLPSTRPHLPAQSPLKSKLDRLLRRLPTPLTTTSSSSNSISSNTCLVQTSSPASPRRARTSSLRKSLSRPVSWFSFIPASPSSLNSTSIASHEPAMSAPLFPRFLSQTTEQIHRRFVDLEWAQRQRIQHGLQNPVDPTATAATPSRYARLPSDPEIQRRNRYANIDPFASNRVVLSGVRNGESDYINASWISMRHTSTGSERRYIACQGPKENNIPHMWRMIHQSTADPAVVVMLTQTHEAGREKCFQYFPAVTGQPFAIPTTNNHVVTTGEDEGWKAELILKHAEYDSALRTTVREIELVTSRGRKTVWHYLFERWPDFGVPEGDDRAALVKLVRATARRAAQASPGRDDSPAAEILNPRVVHCSAGVGRSGTFIALDYLLAELESGAFDDAVRDSPLPDPSPMHPPKVTPTSQPVHGTLLPPADVEARTPTSAVDDEAGGQDRVAETVDLLRQQRMMMVQGECQFLYLYETLRKEWDYRAAVIGLNGNTTSAAAL